MRHDKERQNAKIVLFRPSCCPECRLRDFYWSTPRLSPLSYLFGDRPTRCPNPKQRSRTRQADHAPVPLAHSKSSKIFGISSSSSVLGSFLTTVSQFSATAARCRLA